MLEIPHSTWWMVAHMELIPIRDLLWKLFLCSLKMSTPTVTRRVCSRWTNIKLSQTERMQNMEEIAVAKVTPVQVNFICEAQNHQERLSGPPAPEESDLEGHWWNIHVSGPSGVTFRSSTSFSTSFVLWKSHNSSGFPPWTGFSFWRTHDVWFHCYSLF